MTRSLPRHAVRIASLLALAAALLLVAGAHAAQPAGADARDGGSGHEAGVVADGSATGDSHLPGPVEAPDSEEVSPVGSEHLTMLVLGLFLVSLALLSGAGLVGRTAGRLLERLRLPSVTPLAPVRGPLSLLEVFRL